MDTMMSLGITGTDYIILFAGIIIWFFISLYEEKYALKHGGDGTDAFRIMLETKPTAIRWIVLLAGFAFVLAMGVYGPGYDASAFIYRGF